LHGEAAAAPTRRGLPSEPASFPKEVTQ
jgi:hypothetical protein